MLCSIRTYTIAVDREDILEGGWHRSSVDASASLMLPMAPRLGGGVLVAAEASIAHHAVAPSTVKCSFEALYFQARLPACRTRVVCRWPVVRSASVMLACLCSAGCGVSPGLLPAQSLECHCRWHANHFGAVASS
jgi:hypothetical protein